MNKKNTRLFIDFVVLAVIGYVVWLLWMRSHNNEYDLFLQDYHKERAVDSRKKMVIQEIDRALLSTCKELIAVNKTMVATYKQEIRHLRTLGFADTSTEMSLARNKLQQAVLEVANLECELEEREGCVVI